VILRHCLIVGAAVFISGCGRTLDIPAGEASIAVAPDSVAQLSPESNYRFGPGDEIRVTVFREPELSVDRAVIDPAGEVGLPGIGQIMIAGSTADDVSRALAARLNARLLRNAEVSISVLRTTSRTITVEGSVEKPGIFPIVGRVTLLQALALAEGPNDEAALRQVVVFRRDGERRLAAQFDLVDIRTGRAPDPEIRPGDIVVLGISRARLIYRDILQVLPGLAGIFVALDQNSN